MKRLFFSTFIIISICMPMKAQHQKDRKIIVIEEESISILIAETSEKQQGYRIQVFTGNSNDRQKAHGIKSFVESTFGVNAYVEYESPLFKVRVGDFPDKLEAVALKHQLEKHYNNAYIVPVEEINL